MKTTEWNHYLKGTCSSRSFKRFQYCGFWWNIMIIINIESPVIQHKITFADPKNLKMGARILNFFWKPTKWSNLIYQICLGLVSIKTNKTGNFRHLLTGVELSQKLEITRKVCKPSNLKISKTSVQEET